MGFLSDVGDFITDNPVTAVATGGIVGGAGGALTVAGLGAASTLADINSGSSVGSPTAGLAPLQEFVSGTPDTFRKTDAGFRGIAGGRERQEFERIEGQQSLQDRIAGITGGLEESISPQITAGQDAATRLAGLLSGEISIFDDPAFQAQLQGATRNVQAAAGAGSNLLSGNTLIDLQMRGQELGADFFATQAGLLQGTSQQGLQAAGLLSGTQLQGLGIEGEAAATLSQAQSAAILGQAQTEASQQAGQLDFFGDVLTAPLAMLPTGGGTPTPAG